MTRWLAVVALGFALFTAGCWKRKESDELALVSALGVDRLPDGGILVVAQVVKPAEVRAGVPTAVGSPRAVSLISASGPTVAAAVRGLAQVAGRRPFWAHARVLVLGAELAESGLGDVLDWFFREREFRARVWLAVTPGRAADVIAAESDLEKIPAVAVENMFRGRATTSFVPGANLFRFLRDLATPGKDPLVAALSVVPRAALAGFSQEEGRGSAQAALGPPSPEKEKEERRLYLGGGALFRGERLVGWLNERETRGVLWTAGARGVVVLSSAVLPGGRLSVEVLKTRSSIEPRVAQGQVSFLIKVKLDAALAEQPSGVDLSTPDALKLVEREMEKTVAAEVLSALGKARSLGADPFGLGFVLSTRNGTAWKRLAPAWPDHLRSVPVTVEVSSRVIRTGLSQGAHRER